MSRLRSFINYKKLIQLASEIVTGMIIFTAKSAVNSNVKPILIKLSHGVTVQTAKGQRDILLKKHL